MKRLVLLFALLVFTVPAYCQSLSLDDLVKLVKDKSPSKNELLIDKGWEFHSTKNIKANEGTEITWAYGLNGDNAIFWLVFNYNNSQVLKRTTEHGTVTTFTGGGINDLTATYTTFDLANIKNIRNKIKEYKMKQLSSFPVENGIKEIYSGHNYVIEIVSERMPGEELAYVVAVFNKVHYNKLMDEKETTTTLR